MTRISPPADATNRAAYAAAIYALAVGDEIPGDEIAAAMKSEGKTLADLERDVARARRAALGAALTLVSGAR